MQVTIWDEKVQVISGLLDQQLRLIDLQLQTVGQADADKQQFADALNQIKELCSFARDMVYTLPRSKRRWKISLRPRGVVD